MHGNGYFVMDQTKFACKHKETTMGAASLAWGESYFNGIGSTVELSVYMEKKIAKFENYVIELPDAVCIAITSSNNHIVTCIPECS